MLNLGTQAFKAPQARSLLPGASGAPRSLGATSLTGDEAYPGSARRRERRLFAFNRTQPSPERAILRYPDDVYGTTSNEGSATFSKAFPVRLITRKSRVVGYPFRVGNKQVVRDRTEVPR